MASLAACSAVYALPVGNPAAPELLKAGIFSCEEDCWGVKLGYRGDFVNNRKLKIRNDATGSSNQHFDDYSYHVNAGQLTVNIWDRLDVYGWVGETRTEANNTFAADLLVPVVTVADINISGTTKHRTAWGVGAKAVLWECDRWTLGLDVQYERLKARFDRITILNDVGTVGIIAPVVVPPVFIIDDPNIDVNFHEWQVSLGLSYRVCSLVPYIAIKYSNARGNFKDRDDTVPADLGISLRSQKFWGGVVGLTLVDAERIQVTAEYRFVDECALSILADFKF